jgi:hypothetical protein
MPQRVRRLIEAQELRAREVRGIWLVSLEDRYPEVQRQILRLALETLSNEGGETLADSGETLLTHALGTAAILAAMRFDVETVAAALLCGGAPVRGQTAWSLTGPALVLVELRLPAGNVTVKPSNSSVIRI